jgi:hypothetical protein
MGLPEAENLLGNLSEGRFSSLEDVSDVLEMAKNYSAPRLVRK